MLRYAGDALDAAASLLNLVAALIAARPARRLAVRRRRTGDSIRAKVVHGRE